MTSFQWVKLIFLQLDSILPTHITYIIRYYGADRRFAAGVRDSRKRPLRTLCGQNRGDGGIACGALSVEADRGELDADFQRQVNEAGHEQRQGHDEHDGDDCAVSHSEQG
jgi:hypothetical protein